MSARLRAEPWFRAPGERMERALEEQDRREGITRHRTASGWLVMEWPEKKAVISPAFLVDGALK